MSLSAAVIGLGFVGAGDQVSGDALGQKVANLDGTHAQALAGNARVRLVAGASRDEGRRSRFCGRFPGVRAYADWREMLAREKPEIVSVATRSPEHAETALGCVEAGARAILCEKPIATRLSDADRLIAACRARGVLLAVNHNRRWHPLWRAAREEIAHGAIGPLRHVLLHWPTGRLGNIGTHMFDATRMLLAREPEAVSGALDPNVGPDCRGAQYHDPGGWGVIRFAGGVKVFVDATYGVAVPNEMRLIGEAGSLRVRRDSATVEPWNAPPRTLLPARKGASMDAAVEDLLRALDSGAPLASTGEDALAALEIVVAFHRSHRLNGQWVAVPATGVDREMEIRIG
jgi:predicted dehydrogenase